MIEMKLGSDCSETVPYNYKGLPIHARKYRLSNYPGMACTSHWHDDIEFIAALDGEMGYTVEGSEYGLKKGCGIFVNSGRLHAGHAAEGADCGFLCLVIHPELLCPAARVREWYLNAASSLPDAALLSPGKQSGSAVLEKMNEIYELCKNGRPGFELDAVISSMTLWRDFLEAAGQHCREKAPSADRHMESLRRMVGFIQRACRHAVSLAEIANAGGVSRSVCCDIFSEYLHMPPGEYLICCRIERSAELLLDTELSVTEIAMSCGFCSSSYFAEQFKKRLGRTPREFRKQKRMDT